MESPPTGVVVMYGILWSNQNSIYLSLIVLRGL